MGRKIVITRNPNVDLLVMELGKTNIDGVVEHADHLLAYLHTCVGGGTLNEIVERLFPFEPAIASVLSDRLHIVCDKAYTKVHKDV